MLHASPEMPQYLILAMDHHRVLIEQAERQRMCAAIAHVAKVRSRKRWRRLRFRAGELLVYVGQRLQADAVWG